MAGGGGGIDMNQRHIGAPRPSPMGTACFFESFVCPSIRGVEEVRVYRRRHDLLYLALIQTRRLVAFSLSLSLSLSLSVSVVFTVQLFSPFISLFTNVGTSPRLLLLLASSGLARR